MSLCEFWNAYYSVYSSVKAEESTNINTTGTTNIVGAEGVLAYLRNK